MSYLTQMLGLGVQNFLSAASGMAVLSRSSAASCAARRARSATSTSTSRAARSTSCCRLSLLLALVLMSQGVVQNFSAYKTVELVEPVTIEVPVRRMPRARRWSMPPAIR